MWFCLEISRVKVRVFSAVNFSRDQLERRNGTRLSAFLFI